MNIEKLKNLFYSFDIDIKNETYHNNCLRLKINNCFLFLDELNNEIYLTFNVKIRPDDSANLVSLLSNNLDIKNIYVTEMYYDNKKETYFGDVSYNEYMKDLVKNIIENYKKNEKEFNILKNVKLNTIQ